jgi:hypothetical protein
LESIQRQRLGGNYFKIKLTKRNKMKIELTNDFHNTEVILNAKVLNHGTHLETTLSKYQMRKARRELCGIEGCTCGFAAGTRGFQSVNGKKLVVNVFYKGEI